MDPKPKVFPTKPDADKIRQYEAEKTIVTNEIYSSAVAPTDTPRGHIDAVEMMRQRTAEQLRLRDEQLRKNQVQTQNYQNQAETAINRTIYTPPVVQGGQGDYLENFQNRQQQSYAAPQPVVEQPTYTAAPVAQPAPQNYGPTPIPTQDIQAISQPQFNTTFDVLPLPSEGKLYRNKRPSAKVSFLTTADESILTSPNLLKSGQFLEILLNRKILELDLRYKDLHVGDRNAIMIWLRATSYGHMYPVTLLDENDRVFETEINLNDLKTKKLGATPDAEGYFDFKFNLCQASIKFKLLTVADSDAIEALVEADKASNTLLNQESIYTLQRHIVEVNGTRDPNVIKDFVNSLRIGDTNDLIKYINEIESGIDLTVEVGTPGGGTIKTFLPLNLNFFWPNLRV